MKTQPQDDTDDDGKIIIVMIYFFSFIPSSRLKFIHLRWSGHVTRMESQEAFTHYQLSAWVKIYLDGVRVDLEKLKHGYKLLRFHTSSVQNQLLGNILRSV